MASGTPSSYALRRRFADFDELADEAREWNLDLRQLDRGAFVGEVLQFGIGPVHISEARFGRQLIQKGSPPEGLRTIAVPAEEGVGFSWRGQHVGGEDLAIFPRGADLASVSTPEFHVYTCSFPEELLAALSDSIQVSELDELCGDAGVVRCQPAAIRWVRRCLARMCSQVVKTSLVEKSFVSELPSTDHRLADQITRDLPRRLLGAIATSHASSSSQTTRKRELALVRAEAFIEQWAHEDISMRDICRAAQVSQRTLEYAFVERFGVTPKAFLMACRLNAVRRELRTANPATDQVADIANRWGFWHLGQFAKDFRKKFGELPSQTLRRPMGQTVNAPVVDPS